MLKGMMLCVLLTGNVRASGISKDSGDVSDTVDTGNHRPSKSPSEHPSKVDHSKSPAACPQQFRSPISAKASASPASISNYPTSPTMEKVTAPGSLKHPICMLPPKKRWGSPQGLQASAPEPITPVPYGIPTETMSKIVRSPQRSACMSSPEPLKQGKKRSVTEEITGFVSKSARTTSSVQSTPTGKNTRRGSFDSDDQDAAMQETLAWLSATPRDTITPRVSLLRQGPDAKMSDRPCSLPGSLSPRIIGKWASRRATAQPKAQATIAGYSYSKKGSSPMSTGRQVRIAETIWYHAKYPKKIVHCSRMKI